MRWKKQGLIFCADKQKPWMQTHSQVPCVYLRNDGVLRIFFASRDERGRSNVSYIDVDPNDPKKVLGICERPLLEYGPIGTFDDCGAMPSWIVRNGTKTYMYYIGWTVRNTVPYHNSIGLAVSDDDGNTFKKYSMGPLFSPTVHEPYFTGTSCVLVENGVWKNWYLSCTKWEVIDGRAEPFYNIKYATSEDGINWKREGQVAIDYADEKEGGIVRASVIKENGAYKMWYSHRNGQDYRQNTMNSYRIGYAESSDGVSWVRKDHDVGIDISQTGWDSEMLAYPHVIDHQGERLMFYNGNGFGRSGLGYAVLGR